MNSQAKLQEMLTDPMWRISYLYKIIVKGNDEDEGLMLSRSLRHGAIRIFRKEHEPTYI